MCLITAVCTFQFAVYGFQPLCYPTLIISLISYISFSLFQHRYSFFSGNLNLIHLAERASYRLLDLYRDGGKVEKMAAEYKRAASAFKDISDLASSQFALGTFYSVLYLGLGEGATYLS